MTTADHIRGMNDEEKLKWIRDNFGGRAFTLENLLDRLRQPWKEDYDD